MSIFLGFIWFLCCGYATIPCFWLVAHPFVRHWRNHSRSPYYTLLPIWAGIIAMAMAITWPWHRLRLYDSPAAWLVAALPLVAGLRLYRLGHENFTDAQIIGRPELEHGNREQQLVTSGIRRHVRHPIYIGHLSVLLALCVGSGLAVAWILLAFDLVMHIPMIRVEDRELEARFGNEYREYKCRVPAIIPRFPL